MSEIDETILQIRGRLNTDSEYFHGQDAKVTVTVTSIELIDDQKGKIIKLVKAKLFSIDE